MDKEVEGEPENKVLRYIGMSKEDKLDLEIAEYCLHGASTTIAIAAFILGREEMIPIQLATGMKMAISGMEAVNEVTEKDITQGYPFFD